MLIEEGNDPVFDPPALQEYMDTWDGQLFFDLLHLEKDENVLEIGCGTGRIARKVAPNVKSFCGMDISPQTIAAAKKHLPFANTKLICADFLAYAFDETFDLIYSTLTFLHIENKQKAMEKVFGLLCPGGSFILSIGKSDEEFLDFGTRKLKVYPDDPNETMHILKSNGFSNMQKYETEFAYIFSAEKPL